MNTTDIKPLFLRLKEARRAKGISQSVVARQAGCTQSALCMMENGKADAIARETTVKIAGILGVAIDDDHEDVCVAATVVSASAAFCPNPECLSNVPYTVGEQVILWPRHQSGSNKFCAFCGEVLEHSCPNCDAPVSDGAFCPKCGQPLVTPPQETAPSPAEWTEKRRREISALNTLV